MSESDFNNMIDRSIKIREKYHQLEMKNHQSLWSIEEDALAFLTDAGLVGSHVMSQQNRWPKADTETELSHKMGECFWWLIVLAERMEMSPEELINNFLTKTEQHLAL